MNLSIFGLKNIPYLKEGDSIEKLIEESIKTSEFFIEDNDVLCIASKVVSVAEGQVMSLNEIQVSDVAKEIHRNIPRKDPRIIEIMLNLVNRDLSRLDIKKNYIGCRLENGLKLTSGGIDRKSVDEVFLLPNNPDASAKRISEYLKKSLGKNVAVVITDSDGREDKRGATQVAMFIAIESGNDLIIPNYARKSFEGNATNHFIYPMLVKFFKRDMPYQCISGDFGFSRGLIKDLTLKCNWHKYTLGYGIDIFLTLTAILKSYKIKEIDLQSKIHKKSFEKIEKIFLEVSQSFFETINDNSLNQDKLRLNINFESHSRQFIKSSDILSSNDIENLKLRALFLLQEEKQYPHGLSEVEWDGILSNTINNIYRYSSEEHSLYLLPLYLLRVYNYLKYN